MLLGDVVYNEPKDRLPDNLECVCAEICKPNTSPFYVASLYRPPNFSINIFESFEQFIGRLDCLNNDIFILDDTNCDQLPLEPDGPTKALNNLRIIYQIS